jgi:hypothetical protein
MEKNKNYFTNSRAAVAMVCTHAAAEDEAAGM